MNAVDVVGADEMKQHVHRVGGRLGMPEVEVPVGGELIAALARLRSPLPRAAIGLVPRRIPEMLQKDVAGIARKRIDLRIAVEDRSDDDERVDLDATCVCRIEQSAERVERSIHRLGQRLRGVEIPGVAPPTYLHEERVGIALDGRVDDTIDVYAGRERRPERVDPVGTVFGTRVIRVHRGRGKQEEKYEKTLHLEAL